MKRRHPAIAQLRDASLGWVREIEGEVDEKARWKLLVVYVSPPWSTAESLGRSVSDTAHTMSRKVDAQTACHCCFISH